MTYSSETIKALAELRTYAERYPTMGLSGLINTLDNAGVFAALDEQTDYAPAVEILAEAALGSLEQKSGRWAVQAPDPAEWGDTTADDMARHQGLTALPYLSCTCGRPEETSPALHAGTCPVWAQHHNLT